MRRRFSSSPSSRKNSSSKISRRCAGVAARLQLRHGCAFRRKVHLPQCCLPIRQVRAVPASRRGRHSGTAPRIPSSRSKITLPLPARSQPRPAQRFVHRRNAPHFQQARLGVVALVGQNLKLRLDHLEVAGRPRRFHLSVHRHRLPGMKLVLQVGPVEPHALQRQAALAQGHLEDRHAPRPQQCRPAHLGDHARHLARLQLVQAARILPVFVAKGKVVEQVFGGLDVLGGKHLRHARPHAAHIHHLGFKSGHNLDVTRGGQRLRDWQSLSLAAKATSPPAPRAPCEPGRKHRNTATEIEGW